MSKESTPALKIDGIGDYDAVENLIYLLRQLSIKTAEGALKDLRSDLRGDYYCGECDEVLEDCSGHPDYDYDGPDYDSWDDDRTEEKPSEK